MTQDIVTLYVTLISQFFTLSSSPHPLSSINPALAPLAGDSLESPAPLPPFVPITSNTLTTSHWLLKILAELTECAGEIGALELAGEASATLKEVVASARWRFQEGVCASWVRGITFHSFSQWVYRD
jgi:exocyst complex component 2